MVKSIALLICDTPIPAVLSTYGDYHAIFTTLLRASLPAAPDSNESVFTLDPYDVVHKQEYPSEEKESTYDGIIITGSAASAYENVEWINKLIAYIARIANSKAHIKIIGICFGHQIVARALGGECVPNGGKWEVGVTPLELTDLGKEIFGVDSLNIQQMHRDHVPSVPPTLQLLGSTTISFNQGMVRFYSSPPHTTTSPTPSTPKSEKQLADIHILTVQGHPEFTEPISSAIIAARSKTGVIDAETAEEAGTRKGWRNDGVGVVGKTIWGVVGVPA